MKNVIVPIDGFYNSRGVQKKLEAILSIPNAKDIISHIKLNDVVYGESGCNVMQDVQDWLIKNEFWNIKIFLDLKLSDTSGTNLNILKQYTGIGLFPDILTIRECCSSTTFKEVRELLPNTKLALVSVLTDTSEEECYLRYGIDPIGKIIEDTCVINELCPDVLDAVVCSPLEVSSLKKAFPEMKLIVPGIRDSWMKSGQQKRSNGVRFAFENGADYVVMGAQITKGNPENGISAEESVAMTIKEIEKAQIIVPNDHLQTLKNFQAVYVSPQDDKNNYLGPLVAYAGKGEDGKPKVGYHYYNMARIEQNPRILKYFAGILAEKLTSLGFVIDVVLGAPMGGIALAQALSQELNCEFAFAEKVTLELGDKTKNTKDTSKLVVKRHNISKDARVFIIEDLCNNFSTTKELCSLVDSFGAEVDGIACIVNRSQPSKIMFWSRPVVSVVDLPTDQYEQTDEKVQAHLKASNIVLKPKHEWQKLEDAMRK